jgi:hypothetical protein
MLTKLLPYSYGKLLVVLHEVQLNFQCIKNLRKCTHSITVWHIIFFLFFVSENLKMYGKNFL